MVIPDMLVEAMRGLASSDGSRTIVDLTHQVNLGLLEALVSLLQPRISFVRIIRSRYDTVRSFMNESKVPCGSDVAWTLCPLYHPDSVLKVSNTTWAKLSASQRNMWFVDEVEARWQRLLLTYPSLPHLTVNWCNRDQLLKARVAVADFIGGGVLSPKPCSSHTHGQKNLSDFVLAADDARYKTLVAYPPHLWRMIQRVQTPNDCKW